MKGTRNKLTAPAMSREDWEALPDGAKYFLPWERMKRPERIKPVAPPDKAKMNGYRYFTEGTR